MTATPSAPPGVTAEQGCRGRADVGGEAVVEGHLLERLIAHDELRQEVDQKAVAGPQAEVGVAGGEHRGRLRGSRDAVDDRQPGTPGAADALAGQADRLAGGEDLLRRTHTGVGAADVQDGGHADRVDDVKRRHLLDGVHEDLFVGRVDAAADVHPRAIVGRVGPATAHDLALAALAEGRLGRALRAGREDLVAAELHHAVGLGTVGAGFGEQVDGRLKDAIGEIVVGIDDRVLVPLDAVARDDLAQLGDVTLHVVVGLRGERPYLGALEDLHQIDHGVLLGVGVDGA